MKRNERVKSIHQNTEFSDFGRISGSGITEDNYSEESGQRDYEAAYKRKPWITGTTEDDRAASPVTIIRMASEG